MDILNEQHGQYRLQPAVQMFGATMDGIMDPALQHAFKQLLSDVHTRSDARLLSDLWQQLCAASPRIDSAAAQWRQLNMFSFVCLSRIRDG